MTDTIEKPAATDEQSEVLHQQLTEVESLTNDLKRLLVKYETMLKEEGIRDRVETLERWMEAYRHGLSAANKISQTGTTWLSEVHDKLKLAAEEVQRLEGEGGNPPTPEQAEKTEAMLKTVRGIEKIMPDMDQLFHCSSTQTH